MICPHTLYQLHLTKVPETPFDTLEGRIGVTLLFDNIPLGLADRFAKSEKGFPVDVDCHFLLEPPQLCSEVLLLPIITNPIQ